VDLQPRENKMGFRARSFLTIAATAALVTSAANAAILTENFDEAGGFFGTTGQSNVPSAPVVPGWVVKNNSTPAGPSSWFSGSMSSPFPPQAGSGFAAVNSDSLSGPANTISNWMITPVMSFGAGTPVTFWTRTVSSVTFPDRLQVRLSTNGNSTDVGATNTSVGDFTTLVAEINPNQTQNGYPTQWTLESLNLPVGGTGRLAFRYFVTNAGPGGTNSEMIGIDTLSVVPEPLTGAGAMVALGAGWLMRRRR